MNTIEVKNLYLKYNFGTLALQNINFEVSRGEVMTILGDREAGKTSLIKSIAGLYQPTRGMIINNYEDLLKLPIKDRNVAAVYSENNFFYKKTVEYNVAYPLKIRNIKQEEIDTIVKKCLKLLVITEIADKKISELTPYEKLKVAICRLFVRQPRCFLIDNPLQNFNAKDRWKIFNKLATYIDDLKYVAPVIFTTDSVPEASYFGQKVCLLNYGVEIQKGSITDLKANPESVIAYKLFFPQSKCENVFIEMSNGDVYLEIDKDRVYLKPEYFLNECYLGGEVTICYILNGEMLERASIRIYDIKSERLIYNNDLLA
ncbi:MAG: ATP-binding cassette domain-containing protein [Clostridia bacterium]